MRTTAELQELLAPLNPAEHLQFPGPLRKALAKFSDDEVRHAMGKTLRLDFEVKNPISWLCDRAKDEDRSYFCVPAEPDLHNVSGGVAALSVEPPGDPTQRALRQADPNCPRCDGKGQVPRDDPDDPAGWSMEICRCIGGDPLPADPIKALDMAFELVCSHIDDLGPITDPDMARYQLARRLGRTTW